MLLIDNYSLQKNKRPNYALLNPITPESLTISYRTLSLPTQDPANFAHHSPGELRNLFDKQTSQMESELQILLRYGLISQWEAKRTRAQYEDLYFQDWFANIKSSLLKQSQEDKQSNTVIEKSIPSNSQQPKSLKKFSLPDEDDVDYDPLDADEVYRPTANSNIIGISTQAIRNITGYSYSVQKPWHTLPTVIAWQQELIDAPENVIIVDGSRQWGKSLTIAQKLIEESFIPGHDLMVAAFLQETTESIGEYMLSFIEKFPDESFTYKERKRYIQNNESWVRIHFRTLKDWAKGIRWKTLRLIVVDEAMLVPSNVFTAILLPTQSTIENPKLILLWTASEDTSCYMYQEIINIKKSLKYNNPGQRTGRHIKFSVHDNPLMSPMELRRVMDDQDSPTTKREYFNVWWKLEDSLFQLAHISYTNIADQLSNQAHILLAIDPARKKDRSGYSVLHCLNNKTIILESGEVPLAFKDDWSLQAHFFKTTLTRFSRFQSQSIAIDATGVGDWVSHIFKQSWLPVQDLVRYSVWDSESSSQEGIYNVGKSLLINNAIDMITEKQVIAPHETNELLLEEVQFIQLAETRAWKISFRSEFFDDITNSMMIWLYIAKKRRYINRASISTFSKTTFDDELKTYEPKHPRFSRKNNSSSW